MNRLVTVTSADVDRITGALYIEPPVTSKSSSRFWVLLVLAAIIATAGVVADSTATVIGAMIVAPLMTPILGVAVALVLVDRPHLIHSIAHVVLGALTVVAIGYLIGMITHPAFDFYGNSQVSGRISPRLIDLLAALATGTVGAFALVRSDISDALPGVAIAISLVPPLSVTGLLLEVGRYSDAAQSALLFATNVAAIIATGTAVLVLSRLRSAAELSGRPVGALRGGTIAVVVALLVLVTVPLSAGTRAVVRDERLATQARPIAQEWAQRAGWEITAIDALNGVVVITALGPPPDITPESLRSELDSAGMAGSDLRLRLIVGGSVLCAAGSTTCSYSPTEDPAAP